MTIRWFLGLLIAPTLFSSGRAAESIPVGQRQLFLDDNGIAQSRGLQKTMHSPQKKGAVVCPDQPWEVWVQTRTAPAWNAQRQVFQLWLAVCPPDPRFAGTGYAESGDGVLWTKPILRQREYQGSKENNFLTVDPALSWPSSDATASFHWTPPTSRACS
jgi:hypothetical protein